MQQIRKNFSILLIFTILAYCLSGCKRSELDKNNPVTLSLWHVYGEQSDSPMNRLIDEFNETVGMEKGIIINVTAMSNASKIMCWSLERIIYLTGTNIFPKKNFHHMFRSFWMMAWQTESYPCSLYLNPHIFYS